MSRHNLEETREHGRRRPYRGGGAPTRSPATERANRKWRTAIHDDHFAFFGLQPDRNGKTPSPVAQSSPTKSSSWTFFSNHAHVLLCLHRDPDILLREVAVQVGITERAVQKIVAELEEAQVVKRQRVGRRNHYRIRKSSKLRHPIESHRTVADLLEFVH